MKYPKEIGPQSQTEALAILFGMLGNAYNLLAQYEADERQRESRRYKAELFRTTTGFTYDTDDIECLKKAADQLVAGAPFEDRESSREVLQDIASRMLSPRRKTEDMFNMPISDPPQGGE